jgi:hypothetical protein
MGCASQLDIPENLVSLCALCHHAADNVRPSRDAPERGPVTKAVLLGLVARQEGWEEAALESWLDLLGRATARQ